MSLICQMTPVAHPEAGLPAEDLPVEDLPAAVRLAAECSLPILRLAPAAAALKPEALPVAAALG